MTGPAPRAGRVLVIGAGNADRGDDAAGLAVARRIRAAAPPGVAVLEHEGEPVWLIDVWAGAGTVYLADATSPGGQPGRIYRLDATARPLSGPFGRGGTHGITVAGAVELARALGRLPPRLICYGIEGCRFAPGSGMSPQVRAAVAAVSARLLAELAAGHSPLAGWPARLSAAAPERTTGTDQRPR